MHTSAVHSVTCSPAALESLLLPFFWVQPGWAVCRLSATTTLQTVSLNFYRRAVVGSNLDFWFRHRTSFLWRLRPTGGCVFSSPDTTVPNIYIVFQSDSINRLNLRHFTVWYLFILLLYVLFSFGLWLNCSLFWLPPGKCTEKCTCLGLKCDFCITWINYS